MAAKKDSGFWQGGILRTLRAGFAAICFVTNAYAVTAIEDVRYLDQKKPAVIEIELGFPVQLISFSPKGMSDYIVINLRIRDPDSVNGEDLSQEKKAPEDSTIPLESVISEVLSDRNFRVTAKFSEKVRFAVYPSSDPTKILISLLDIQYAHAMSDKKIAAVLNKGLDALKQGNNAKAIQLYTSILDLPESTYHASALEYLGIARQRNSQLAQAKTAFEEYLQKYPDNEGNVRVRQRLAELLSNQLAPQQSSLEPQKPKSKLSNIDQFGSFNQYLLTSKRQVDGEKPITEQMTILSSIDYSSRARSNGTEWRTLFYADHQYNLDEKIDEGLDINTLNARYKNDNVGAKVSAGRQSSTGAGVLGRFDGVMLQIPLLAGTSGGLTTGFPVDLSDKNKIQTNKPFVAVNASLANLIQSLEVKPYYSQQQVDNILTRSAVGTELSYASGGGFIYHLTDYDLKFKALNIWLVQSQIQTKNNSSFHFSLDFRRNPSLDLGNALINEFQVDNLKDLARIMSIEQILQQAIQRTSKSYNGIVGANLAITPNIQLAADFIRSDQVFNTLDVDGINYIVAHDYQNEFSTQLIASNLLDKRDTLLADLRYTDANNFNNASFSVRDQIWLTNQFQIDLRIRLGERKRDTGEILRSTSPALMLTYQATKTLWNQIEIGYEKFDFAGTTLETDYKRLFANMIYRLSY